MVRRFHWSTQGLPVTHLTCDKQQQRLSDQNLLYLVYTTYRMKLLLSEPYDSFAPDTQRMRLVRLCSLTFTHPPHCTFLSAPPLRTRRAVLYWLHFLQETEIGSTASPADGFNFLFEAEMIQRTHPSRELTANAQQLQLLSQGA